MSSDPLNLSPYTVVRDYRYISAYNVMEGTRTVTGNLDHGAANRLVSLLNDAYRKGVEDERAWRDAVIEANLAIGADHAGDQSGVFAEDKVDYRQQVIDCLVATYGFTPELAARIVTAGICSPAAFDGVIMQDLIDIGFTPREATYIILNVNRINRAESTGAAITDEQGTVLAPPNPPTVKPT